jgi:hypothetical protein
MQHITLRRIYATILALEKQSVLHNFLSVFVALGIQHAMHMPHIVICVPPHSKIFYNIIS